MGSSLSGLSLEQLHQIPATAVSGFSRRSYLPAHSGRFWLLKTGVVRTLTYQEDGSTVALGLWSAGDIVGRPLSAASPYLIETITEVEALAISAAEWHPPAEVMLSYLRQTEALMLVRSSRRAEAALLGVLQWLADRFGQQIDRGCLIDLKITHQDLADLSDTTRVTVTRLLRQFEDQGLIYRRSRQLILTEASENWHYEI